jgi:hypothetical protein
MGFSQGKFSIAETRAGEKFVARDPSMVRLHKGPDVTTDGRQVVHLSGFKGQAKSCLQQ